MHTFIHLHREYLDYGIIGTKGTTRNDHLLHNTTQHTAQTEVIAYSSLLYSMHTAGFSMEIADPKN